MDSLLSLQALFWFGWILSVALFLSFSTTWGFDFFTKRRSMLDSALPAGLNAHQAAGLVLRLLRGEPLETVSREGQIPSIELERLQHIFVEHGTRGFLVQGESRDHQLLLARAKIGELVLRLELAEELIRKSGLLEEWEKHSQTQRWQT